MKFRDKVMNNLGKILYIIFVIAVILLVLIGNGAIFWLIL